MKKINYLIGSLALATLFMSCSNDDDNPEPIHGEEVITTLTVTLTPNGGGDTITLQYQDLDGDGPLEPETTVSGSFLENETYDGFIELLNETEDPADNITEEVEEEAEEHQFFYTIGGALDIDVSYANFDENEDPLGTEFTLITGEESSGSLTFTLRHEPKKPNTGLEDAGGETDITVTFNLSVGGR